MIKYGSEKNKKYIHVLLTLVNVSSCSAHISANWQVCNKKYYSLCISAKVGDNAGSLLTYYTNTKYVSLFSFDENLL